MKLTSRQAIRLLREYGVTRGALYAIRLGAGVTADKRIVQGRAMDFYTKDDIEKMKAFCERRKREAKP